MENDFPAKLILSAIREEPDGSHRIVVCADGIVCHTEEDLALRQALYESWELAHKAKPYNYIAAHVDDLEEAMADIRATLEAQIDQPPESEPESGAGDAPTSPAPEHPPAKEEPELDNTTDPAEEQAVSTALPPAIVLTVRYQGTGASIIPTGQFQGSTAELVDWRDGRNDRPPDQNIERLRLWLEGRGYQPSYPEWEWLDRGHGPRRRREVYRLNGTHQDHGYETVDWNALRRFAQQNPIPRLGDEERLALYKSKALAGEGVFAPCRECPQVEACPHGWGACDRKRAWATERQRELDRPRSYKNPRYHAFYNY